MLATVSERCSVASVVTVDVQCPRCEHTEAADASIEIIAAHSTLIKGYTFHFESHLVDGAELFARFKPHYEQCHG